MQRVEQYATELLSKTWKDPATGALLDPGTVTIGITRADGTVVIAPVTATGSGAAARTYSLTQTTLLDSLAVTWTSSTYGPRRPDIVEIVGGFLCSLGELGEVVTGKTSAELEDIRTQLEQRLEKALGYACVPRYALETKMTRNGRIATRLPLRAIRSLSVAGSAYTVGQVAALQLTNSSVYGVWAAGPVIVGYEHGRDLPDEDITRAMLLAADEVYGAQAVGVGAPVVSQQADNMSVTYGAYLVAKSPFVGSELNAIIRANALPSIY